MARKLCWRFFFCFHLHCSDQRISETQKSRPYTHPSEWKNFHNWFEAKHGQLLQCITERFKTIFVNRSYFITCLCIYIYEYVLTLQEVNTLVDAYGVSVCIRMSAISFFVATLPCFISHFHQQKGDWQTLLVFMFPRERVFPIIRTASQFLDLPKLCSPR